MNAEAKVAQEVLLTLEQIRDELRKKWGNLETYLVPERGDGVTLFIAKMTVLAIARYRRAGESKKDIDGLYSVSFYEPFKEVVQHDVNHDRRFLPTLPDLVDRLTIVQQKMIFIPEKADEYERERADLIHDIDILVKNGHSMTGKALAAVVMIMLTNRVIWENESLARKGGSEQDKMLKFTHSINGVRNSAKNVLAAEMGGRHDYKVDCFAGEFGETFGNWDVLKNL